MTDENISTVGSSEPQVTGTSTEDMVKEYIQFVITNDKKGAVEYLQKHFTNPDGQTVNVKAAEELVEKVMTELNVTENTTEVAQEVVADQVDTAEVAGEEKLQPAMVAGEQTKLAATEEQVLAAEVKTEEVKTDDTVEATATEVVADQVKVIENAPALDVNQAITMALEAREAETKAVVVEEAQKDDTAVKVQASDVNTDDNA